MKKFTPIPLLLLLSISVLITQKTYGAAAQKKAPVAISLQREGGAAAASSADSDDDLAQVCLRGSASPDALDFAAHIDKLAAINLRVINDDPGLARREEAEKARAAAQQIKRLVADKLGQQNGLDTALDSFDLVKNSKAHLSRALAGFFLKEAPRMAPALTAYTKQKNSCVDLSLLRKDIVCKAKADTNTFQGADFSTLAAVAFIHNAAQEKKSFQRLDQLPPLVQMEYARDLALYAQQKGVYTGRDLPVSLQALALESHKAVQEAALREQQKDARLKALEDEKARRDAAEAAKKAATGSSCTLL